MSNFNYRWGRVCKLWHVVSCRPELWKSVDLAQYTTEKCKTDYKLVWLLENRLSQCQSLNIGKKQLNILVVTIILNRRLLSVCCRTRQLPPTMILCFQRHEEITITTGDNTATQGLSGCRSIADWGCHS